MLKKLKNLWDFILLFSTEHEHYCDRIEELEAIKQALLLERQMLVAVLRQNPRRAVRRPEFRN